MWPLNNIFSSKTILRTENIHFKHPQEQMKQIDNTIKIFDEFGQNPKLFTLYADNLHYVSI